MARRITTHGGAPRCLSDSRTSTALGPPVTFTGHAPGSSFGQAPVWLPHLRPAVSTRGCSPLSPALRHAENPPHDPVDRDCTDRRRLPGVRRAESRRDDQRRVAPDRGGLYICSG